MQRREGRNRRGERDKGALTAYQRQVERKKKKQRGKNQNVNIFSCTSESVSKVQEQWELGTCKEAAILKDLKGKQFFVYI